MSFLNQLRQQAQAVQSRQHDTQGSLERALKQTEEACGRIWRYLQDLQAQLNVIQPELDTWTLDGRQPWPRMRLQDFRIDARRKTLQGQEVHDNLAMVWRMLPADPSAARHGRVSVNFPPDLERVERRLQAARVPHERSEQRQPETNRLQFIHFDYTHEARAGVQFAPDHERAQVRIRLVAVGKPEVEALEYPAAELQPALLDELAKRIVGAPHRLA